MPTAAGQRDEASEEGQPLDNKARILQAAVKVFATRGYDAATVREITRLVGVSHGLIRYHFANKETLWRAAIRFTFERAIRAMTLSEAETAGLSAWEKSELEIRKSVTYYGKHPEHVRIVIQEIMADGERLRWIVDNFTGQMVNEAVARTAEYLKPTSFHGMDPMHYYYAISAASRMFFVMAPEVQRIFGIDPTTPEAIEAHVQIIARLAIREQD